MGDVDKNTQSVQMARDLAHAMWVAWNERLRAEFDARKAESDARDAYRAACLAADAAFERAEQAQSDVHVALRRARNAKAGVEYRQAWEEAGDERR